MEDEMVVALGDDLWGVIGSKLDTSLDRTRFRAVSKAWKSLLPFRQPPWLMLAESKRNSTNGGDASTRRGFASLGEEKAHEIDLPEIHQALCAGSTGNWLSTVHLDKTIRLLNPFTRVQFHLPPVTTLQHQLDTGDEEMAPEFHRDYLINKIVLSSPPGQRNCVAIALYHYYRVLAFARPGDASWTSIQVTGRPLPEVIGIDDMVFYRQKLYAVTSEARLMVCDDIHGDGDAAKLSYITDALTKYSADQVKYLVECAGDLLLVIKFVHANFDPDEKKEDEPEYKTTGFQVFKFDFTAIKFNELKSLGVHSLFLGLNTSFSLPASDYYPWVRRNCIYFTDDFTLGYIGSDNEGGHDMGIFNLDDNSITPHFRGLSTSHYSPPLWFFPA